MKIFALLLLFLTGTLCAMPHHSPQLSPSLNAIYQNTETRELLFQAEKAGLQSIQATEMGADTVYAAWFPDYKTICVNFSRPRTQGNIIHSIVFEMHNVLSQKQFDQLDQLAMQGRISKEKYIESVEYIEYMNALKTTQVLKNGVDKRIFPTDAPKNVASTFAEHFSIQKQYGHSKIIGDIWESLKRSRMS